MKSLEALPLEIHEHILAYLLPRERFTDLAAVPACYHYKVERVDIYNIRLTCRRLRAAASQAFVGILEDLPTKCQERTLHNLTALLQLPDISRRLTCLTLSPYHLFICKFYPHSFMVHIDLPRSEFEARYKWLRDTLQETLITIIALAPKLRHLICVIQCFVVSFDDGGNGALLGSNSSEVKDPMHIIQAALAHTQLSEKLESIHLLSSANSDAVSHETAVPEKTLKPLSYTKLRHLTLRLVTRTVSNFRTGASHLTSLCIVLDRRCEAAMSHMLTQGVCFPELCPTLRNYTIRGDYMDTRSSSLLCETPTKLLAQFLALIFERDSTLPTVSLEHIVAEE